ncbi:MAG: J domain-containing protein [Terracidiphilus sp.]|jgi:hypothetical protein
MSCECAQCKQHYRTLGIAFGIPEESAIEEAYREGVKQWHPDLYENFASLRADAEEHFKQIQVAYRELKEHNAVAAESPLDSIVVETKRVEMPSISFGDAPGCQAAPHFTTPVEEMIARQIGTRDTAIAIVDIGGVRSQNSSFSQFFLLTDRGIMVRDARNLVTLLLYKDLGEINLIDRQKPSKPGMWQSLVDGIAGGQSKCVLQINRNNGTLFYSLSGQAEDSVKKAIYDFLLRQKALANS